MRSAITDMIGMKITTTGVSFMIPLISAATSNASVMVIRGIEPVCLRSAFIGAFRAPV